MKKQDTVPMSLREIAKLLNIDHMMAGRYAKRFGEEISKLNPFYLLPYILLTIEIYSKEKVKKLLGKKGLKDLDKYLTELEKVLQCYSAYYY